MTLTHFARILGVDRRTLYNWRHGKTGISLASAEKGYQIFGEMPPIPIVVPHSRGLRKRLDANEAKHQAACEAILSEFLHRMEESETTSWVSSQNGKRK